MTSPTGSDHLKPVRRFRGRCGFTFVEMMTTLAILSMGIVLIYKSFFLCVDYLTHVQIRLSANILLDHKVNELEQALKEFKDLTLLIGEHVKTVKVQNRTVDIRLTADVVPVDEYPFLYQAKVSAAWKERQRVIALTRDALLSSVASTEAPGL